VALKNDAASAGLGFFGDSRYLCAALNLGVGATPAWDGVSFAPVRITRPGGLDRIDVLQASRVESGANVLLAQASSGADASLKSYLPAAVGDAVLLSPDVVGDPCLVRTVTAVTPSTVDTPAAGLCSRRHPQPGRVHHQPDLQRQRRRHQPARSTELAALPHERHRPRARAAADRRLGRAGAQRDRLSRAIRVRRAWAAARRWKTGSMPPAPCRHGRDHHRARAAVRVGVVVRSPQREKPNVSGVCEASLAKPRLFGAEVEPDVADWACYRFRSAVLVIPLRNLVLGM
jgi:type IV pilus assembly protein PilW